MFQETRRERAFKETARRARGRRHERHGRGGLDGRGRCQIGRRLAYRIDLEGEARRLGDHFQQHAPMPFLGSGTARALV